MATKSNELPDDVLEEAILDLIDNIAGLNAGIQEGYKKGPEDYTEGYGEAYASAVAVITEENLRALIEKAKKRRILPCNGSPSYRQN